MMPLCTPSLTHTSAVTVAVDPVALVITECMTITSAMCKHAPRAHSGLWAMDGDGSLKPPPAQRARRVGNATMLDEDDMESSRWGRRGKRGEIFQDNRLVVPFSRLRSNLRNCKDITNYDTPALLHPFLQVIRSPSTSPLIISLALTAITKFLSYNIISGDSPRLAEAMQLLSSAITQCRFEASDPKTDEVVLLRILKLMGSIIMGPGGEILGDESVCEMMETGLSICCQPMLSEVLRRSAEIEMVSICQVIFERLKHLEVEVGDEPGALDKDTKADMDSVKMHTSKMQTSSTGTKAGESKSGEETGCVASVEKPIDGSTGVAMQNGGGTIDLPATHNEEDEGEALSIKPYSLPSIQELLRVLVNMLDPHDKRHTDTMRIMALRMLDVALEVTGPSIVNHPSLATLAKDKLCRYLFQLVRSDNMAILKDLLRVCGTLLATCRGVLRLQQELFLSYVVAYVFPIGDIPLEPGIEPFLYEGVPQLPSLVKQSQSPSQVPGGGKPTPAPVKDRRKLGLEDSARTPDAREAMVESVSALVRIPSFMVELFVNYDCDVDRSNMCSDVVGLLSRNAFPDSAQWRATNVAPLSLDSLLSYVQLITDRLDDAPATEGFPDPDALRRQWSRKNIIIKGASKFNENPKAGIAFLATQEVIQDPENPMDIAEFIKGTTRIDKKVLGEFISKKTNEDILKEFMKLLNFAGKRIDEAVRELLGTFRLPGESALIERIVEVFAAQYMADATPAEIADSTAAFVLVYATILLNTDQHNPNFKGQKRMEFDDFARNLRGVNDKKNFDVDFLREIFDSIQKHEIILPEEHNDNSAYDHAWKELLVKVDSTSDLASCNTNIFDADMFAATWKPIVATLSYVFMSTTDDAVFARVVTGLDQCAQIAGTHGLSDALDRIVVCLSHISTLALEVAPSTSLNTEVQHEESSIMVSETAVRFGRDDRAQLATVVLFRILNGNESAIRDGWEQILRILLNLFINSLLPSSFFSARKSIELPSIPLQSPTQIIGKNNEAADPGLFSAFTSYVSSFANGGPPEPSDQEIEDTLSTINTISACSLGEIASNIASMSIEALRSLFITLLSQLSEHTSPRVTVNDVPSSSPMEQSRGKGIVSETAYDPCLAFILELLTALTLRDRRTMEVFGGETAGALQNVIHGGNHVHPIIVSRVVCYLLRLLRSSDDHDFIKTTTILQAFSSLDTDLLQQCAGPLLQELAACIGGPPPLRNEMTGSPDFWSILHRLRIIPETAAGVFKISEDLAGFVHTGISAGSYEATVQLLNEFATTAGVGAVPEQRTQEQRPKGQRQSPLKKAEPSEIVQRGVRATNIVCNLTIHVPQLITESKISTPEAWNAYWYPLFRALTAQCLNPRREIHTQAVETLHRAFLKKNGLVSADHTEWTKIFSQVLFPLITQLLRPEVYQSDPVGISEARVRASTLLCRCYLHSLTELVEWVGFLDLWLNIINVMDRLMNIGQEDKLEEVVAENFKNILLVMANGEYLAPLRAKPEQVKLWNETWKRMEKFLPHLSGELFPEVETYGDGVHNHR